MPYEQIELVSFGGAEQLHSKTVADLPDPQVGDVRIRVLVTSAAFTDVMIRKGMYPDVKEKPPFVLGYDLVGVVNKTGPGVTEFAVGDRVADLTTIGSCFEYICRPAGGLTKVTEFDLPVYFFLGRYDMTANPDLSRAYFDRIEAPVTGLYTFENSAHSPLFEEPDRATEILLQDVMQGTNTFSDVN